ncbi:hypothetical protein AB1K91_07140 [Terribacillus sp. 179-K 1B1 HS]|uniref:hypothetical protein n=1 Tax=Terribacillus sp. 179-K 1B1 HS TaxID=3142388 RepID=UPI0039A0D112
MLKETKKSNPIRIDKLNVDFGQLNHSFLPEAIKNKNPVIAVKYEPFQKGKQTFIIDGSHRAAATYFSEKSKGKKFPSIRCYMLSPKQSMDCMCHDVFRTFYKIHDNLTKISGNYFNSETNDLSKLYIIE